MMRFIITIFILTLITSPAFTASNTIAATSNQSVASLVTRQSSITAGQPFWIALRIELSDGWHSYWKNPGDSGLATNVTLTLPKGFNAGEIQWQTPHRLVLSGIVNYGYSHEAWHFIKITPPSDLPQSHYTISAKAEWLACADICIPQQTLLSKDLPVSTQPVKPDATFEEKFSSLPTPITTKVTYSVTKDQLTLVIPDGQFSNSVAFYPLDNGIVSNTELPVIKSLQKGISLEFKRSNASETSFFRGVLHDLENAKSYEISAVRQAPIHSTSSEPTVKHKMQSSISFPAALLLAFAGGLLLNLMPCVLPILSLKALSLVRLSTHSRSQALTHGIAYTLGILCSFTGFAVALIILQQAGTHIGWGFQLQSPMFVAGLSLLMLLVGLNLSGLYELPVLFGSKGQSLSAQPGALGSFATGILAVAVATPCTAPLMAPAIGFALSQTPVMLLSIFLFLGLGLAAPFLLISAYPSWVRLLPKPGLWMLHLKQFLAFPMYGTSAWLAWVLTRQAGTDALAILLASGLLCALLVWIAAISHTRIKRLLMGLLMIALSYSALSLINQLGTGKSIPSDVAPYSQQALDSLTQNGKPVFVYATADWCITCKVNEKLVLNTDQVKNYFRTHGVTVMEADWTQRDPEITKLLQHHGRAGVPVYLYYAPGKQAVLLPQLLTVNIIKTIIK